MISSDIMVLFVLKPSVKLQNRRKDNLMRLIELVGNYPCTLVWGNMDTEVEFIVQDNRQVKKGALFFAIKGDNVDGHDFIQKAINSGAKTIVGSDIKILSTFKEQGVTLVKVDHQRLALSHFSSRFFQNPSRNLVMTGVTGTNGKTSTCKILSDLLEYLKVKTGVLGTISNHFAGKVFDTKLTTPEPVSLHGFLNEMVNEGITHCVMEVSSHALDLKRVAHVCYDYGIFTNLTEDHLDYHQSFEDYFYAKVTLFNKVSKGRLINGDDFYGQRLYQICEEKKDGIRTWRFGMGPENEVRPVEICYEKDKTVFTVETPFGKIRAEVPLLGKVGVLNTMAALGILVMMRKSTKGLSEALLSVNPVPGRMELVGDGQSKRVFVDYAHTPDALEHAIEIARELTSGRVVLVFGCGGNRDKMKRPEMGKIAKKTCERVFVTSDNPRHEDPQTIIEDILKGIENKKNVTACVDRRKAIQMAIQEAQLEDVVLIAGKGHETYQEICGVRQDFDDRKVAWQALSGKEES